MKFLSDVRLSLLALCVSVTDLCFYYEGFSFLDNALSKIFMQVIWDLVGGVVYDEY